MEKNNSFNRITDGIIWKELLLFALPVMLGYFFQQFYNTVDTIVVGRFVSKQALAAVGGSTGTIINLMIGLFNGLSGGATVLISQFFGAGKLKETNKALHTSLAISLVGGLLLAVIGYGLSVPALHIIAVPDDVFSDALIYMRIYFLGSVFSLVYNMASGIIRAMGDSKRPLYFLIASSVFNIIVDISLVVGLNMGVAGAAIATIASQAFSALLCIVYLMKAEGPYHLDIKLIAFDLPITREVFRLGVPMALQSALYSISNVIIQSSINSFGTDAVAAWSAYGKIDGFFWMMISAFGIAVTTFSGQNFGARKYERIHESVKSAMIMTLIFSAVLPVLVISFGYQLLGLFTDDAVVKYMGLDMMKHIVPFYFTYLGVEVLGGAVRGAGDTFAPTVITVFGVCVLRALWIFFVAPITGNIATVEISYPVTWAATSVMFLIYYFFGGWLEKCKQRRGFED